MGVTAMAAVLIPERAAARAVRIRVMNPVEKDRVGFNPARANLEGFMYNASEGKEVLSGCQDCARLRSALEAKEKECRGFIDRCAELEIENAALRKRVGELTEWRARQDDVIVPMRRQINNLRAALGKVVENVKYDPANGGTTITMDAVALAGLAKRALGGA